MGWISNIAQGIETAFNAVRPALQAIPPILLLCEVFKRPGLSAIASTSAIIKRMPEASIETGINPCGSPNMNNQFIRIVCEEVIKEIKDNAKVTCVLQPGTINSVGTGANVFGPVVVTSFNTIPTNIYGITQ